MSRLVMIALAVMVLAGCGGEEPPTCQQAVLHYYDSGCTYYDLESGQPISAGTMVAACRDILQAAPASCEDEIEDWLFCMDGVPANAMTNTDCDCSYEQERLLTCG